MSAEGKARIAASQKARWQRRRRQTERLRRRLSSCQEVREEVGQKC